jgi:hypothetical protein
MSKFLPVDSLYRDVLYKNCEKLIRQRRYYLRLIRRRRNTLATESNPTQIAAMTAEIQSLERSAADLQFIADRTLTSLPVEDQAAIHHLADDVQDSITRRYRRQHRDVAGNEPYERTA